MEPRNTRPTAQFRMLRSMVPAVALAITALAMTTGTLLAQGPLSPGEILRYKVRWSFIRLGTIEIRQCPLEGDASAARRFELKVTSAAGLPFINLDITHTTTAFVDPLEVTNLHVENRGGDDKNTTYLVERDAHRLVVIDSLTTGAPRSDTISLDSECYEALSLLLLARMRCQGTDTLVITTLVNRDVGETILEFGGRAETVDVPAFENDVEAFHFTGDARWVGEGFAGMKGRFAGWISQDESALPLRAEVSIFLGSIVMELESVVRPTRQLSDTAISAVKQTH